MLGNQVTAIAPKALDSGEVVLTEQGVYGVATASVSEGAECVLSITGTARALVEPAEVYPAGTPLFPTINGRLSSRAMGGGEVAVAQSAKAAGVTRLSVVLGVRALARPGAWPQLSDGLRLTVKNGELLSGGRPFQSIGINAYDLFEDFIKGGSLYATDLATMAAKGIKYIRVSAIPFAAADIATYVGTNGAAPVSTYKAKLNVFLNKCAEYGIGVILSMTWQHQQLLTALTQTAPDLAVSTSNVRVWLRSWAGWLARNFHDHPALSAWGIANEMYNAAFIDTFVTATADATKDHFAAVVAIQDDMAAAVRVYDRTRAVLCSGGLVGPSQSGMFASFAERYVAAAGTCDAVSIHIYPHDWLNGSNAHAFVGTDAGGMDALLRSLLIACKAVGKALIVDEFAGAYDSPPESIAPIQRQKLLDAGVSLCLDWGWYTTAAGGANDLKTTRAASMDAIAAVNATLVGKAPPVPTPLRNNSAPAGKFLRTAAVSGGAASFPFPAALQPQAGKAYAVMFRMRERGTAMAQSRRVMACNDAAGGFQIDCIDNDGIGVADHLRFQLLAGGSLKSFSNLLSKRRPGEWHHYVFAWDGVTTGNSVGAQYVDGVASRGTVLSNTGAPGVSALSLWFGAQSDGTTVNAIDIADVVLINRVGALLSGQEVADYYNNGVLPAGTVEVIPLAGDMAGRLTGNVGTLGANASFAG